MEGPLGSYTKIMCASSWSEHYYPQKSQIWVQKSETSCTPVQSSDEKAQTRDGSRLKNPKVNHIISSISSFKNSDLQLNFLRI